MKHLSEKAKAAKHESQLQESHMAMAKKVLKLSHESQSLIGEIINLLEDHELAAAFKAKIEGSTKTKSEGGEPGDPFTAGTLLDFGREAKGIITRGEGRNRKNRQRIREELDQLNGKYIAIVAKHENVSIGYSVKKPCQVQPTN